jgi:hypothetical protein
MPPTIIERPSAVIKKSQKKSTAWPDIFSRKVESAGQVLDERVHFDVFS